MKPTKEQLEQLKNFELGMLIEFVKICKEHDLKYYLLYGTLLGAVRHQGFIPWDDDIDVGMPRKDYEKFLEIGQDLLPKHMFLQNNITDKGYLMSYSKIRNCNTTFIETTSAKMKINHGVFIDIFPLDYCPENVKVRKQIEKKDLLYARRIAFEYTLLDSAPLSLKIKMLIKKMILMPIMPSVKAVVYKRGQLHKSIPQSSILRCYGDVDGAKELIPVEWYGDGIDLIFEGISVKGPREYDKYLQHIYGDYMQLPPVEKRVGHHYVDIIDLERSYKEYTE